MSVADAPGLPTHSEWFKCAKCGVSRHYAALGKNQIEYVWLCTYCGTHYAKTIKLKVRIPRAKARMDSAIGAAKKKKSRASGSGPNATNVGTAS